MDESEAPGAAAIIRFTNLYGSDPARRAPPSASFVGTSPGSSTAFCSIALAIGIVGAFAAAQSGIVISAFAYESVGRRMRRALTALDSDGAAVGPLWGPEQRTLGGRGRTVRRRATRGMRGFGKRFLLRVSDRLDATPRRSADRRRDLDFRAVRRATGSVRRAGTRRGFGRQHRRIALGEATVPSTRSRRR